MGKQAHPLEKIHLERPSSFNYLGQALRYGPFSLTFWREVCHLTAYYGINHVKGLQRAHIGTGTRIRPTVLLRDAERIYLGRYCTINHNNILWAGKSRAIIRLGDHVITGPDVMMFAFNHGHDLTGQPMANQPFTERDILVDDDVWIGAGSILVAGAKVGKGTVIGAGSVVTGELPAYTICAGIPASVIRER